MTIKLKCSHLNVSPSCKNLKWHSFLVMHGNAKKTQHILLESMRNRLSNLHNKKVIKEITYFQTNAWERILYTTWIFIWAITKLILLYSWNSRTKSNLTYNMGVFCCTEEMNFRNMFSLCCINIQKSPLLDNFKFTLE